MPEHSVRLACCHAVFFLPIFEETGSEVPGLWGIECPSLIVRAVTAPFRGVPTCATKFFDYLTFSDSSG